ncbi:MAG: 23S rRNA (guanosine(2251)-2'-O)-methyltransferase RlmB [Myxococcales bacterium]|nr:23S rRNA (guanosine(2251)-2'-O)-methyltransferase RlmB [Myxococcota bacterium]MDW8282385.1 23S rRNA (guanosine(2251)-2'-O)-methyltransferase RlmB [Myxococcales bacterium]
MVWGVHAVTEVIRGSRQVSALLVAEGAEREPGLRELIEAARRRGLQPLLRRRSELDRLVGGATHQGVVALCGEYVYATLGEILQRAAGASPLVLVLDGVTDPQNLGALLRCACVLGAHGVVLPQDRAAPVTAAAVRASAGASEQIAVARVPNLVRALGELREAGLWLLGAVAALDAAPLWEVDLAGPTALVLGSEGRGLRPLVRKTCDRLVTVPMAPGLRGASLNVAAAGAVLLYEALRQRKPSPHSSR